MTVAIEVPSEAGAAVKGRSPNKINAILAKFEKTIEKNNEFECTKVRKFNKSKTATSDIDSASPGNKVKYGAKSSRTSNVTINSQAHNSNHTLNKYSKDSISKASNDDFKTSNDDSKTSSTSNCFTKNITNGKPSLSKVKDTNVAGKNPMTESNNGIKLPLKQNKKEPEPPKDATKAKNKDSPTYKVSIKANSNKKDSGEEKVCDTTGNNIKEVTLVSQKYFGNPERTTSNLTATTIPMDDDSMRSSSFVSDCPLSLQGQYHVNEIEEGDDEVIDYEYGDDDCYSLTRFNSSHSIQQGSLSSIQRGSTSSLRKESFGKKHGGNEIPSSSMSSRSIGSNGGGQRRARRSSLVGSTPLILEDIVVDGHVIESGSLNQASDRVKKLPRERHFEDSSSSDDSDGEF